MGNIFSSFFRSDLGLLILAGQPKGGWHAAA